MNRLKAKVVLITGGTTGIGRESARLFRDEGASVVVTGVNSDNLAKAADELGVDAVRCDATDLTQIDALMAHVKGRYGRLDVVFANAGTGSQRPIEAVDETFFDQMIALNLRGVYFTVQKALPLMGQGGSIILTASVAARIGTPGGTVYGATKAAVRSLGRSFAAELASRQIRVNTLTPGPIDTPLMGKSGMPVEVVSEMMRKIVPMGRIGTALETANAALFLASDDSSYMTAAELVVSGGLTDI